MNQRIEHCLYQAGLTAQGCWDELDDYTKQGIEKFAQLIVKECVNREELLGAIARGWCSEKNSHKTMDSDLALAIFDEVERQIKHQFGVEEHENH
jgi:hypothetical protein